MADLMSDVEAWEYGFLAAKGGEIAQLMRRLNEVAAEGWELVGMVTQDAGFGTAIGAPIRRPIEPLPEPVDLSEGWYADPSGRFDRRHWNGRAWTFHVAREADAPATHRDPPTARQPTLDIIQ